MMEKKKRVKYFIMDVDGTLTDGTIAMSADGEVFKNFNVKDGYGIRELLPARGIVPVIFTGRKSAIVEKRGAELGITEIYQGVKNKLEMLWKFMDDNGVTGDCIACIGDDLNDFEVMAAIGKQGGMTGCPGDAVPEIREIAGFICTLNGGKGAVREFIDYLVNP